MDFDREQRLIPYLLPGERILWSGQPKKGLTFRAADLILVPFGLMWGGFALFWELGVLGTNAPLVFKLWGIPFCVLGLWLIAGRFLGDAWMRSRTTYGVTDKRVLVVAGTRSMRGIDLDGAGDVQVVERNDGSGTIVFGVANAAIAKVLMWAPGAPRPNIPGPPVLDMVPDVRHVAEIIRSARPR